MKINSLEDLKKASNHPYAMNGYLTDGTQIFDVTGNDEQDQALIDTYEKDELDYDINWEDNNLFTEDGYQIKPAY